MKPITQISIIVLIFFLISIPALSQMTAERVLDNMRAQYEKSIEKIDDYTVVTNVYTAYYKKIYVDGKPVFVTRTELTGMEALGGFSSSAVTQGDLFDTETYEQLRKNAKYEGTAQVDGNQTHVLFVPELKHENDDAGVLLNARMYVDAQKWVIRKMTFETKYQDPSGEEKIIDGSMKLEDYRSVEGLLLPYRTVMAIEGLDDAMSPEDKEQARKGLAELEQQMQQMSEAERQMMERMLKPQIERLRKVLEGDKMEFIVEVKEVKVNTGLSDELFK